MIQEGKCGAFNPLLIECLSEIQLSIEEELNKTIYLNKEITLITKQMN